MIDKRQAKLDTAPNPWLFLGFDLRQIPAVWLDGWKEALRWPILAWLNTAPPVRVFQVDGTETLYTKGGWWPLKPTDKSASHSDFRALLLPDDVLLHRVIVLPKMPGSDLQQVLSFEVDGITPFGRDQTVWGYQIVSETAQNQRIELVITARAQIEQALMKRNSSVPADMLEQDALELWAMGEQSRPVTLIGFAEQRRQRFIRRRVLQMAALLLLIPVLTIALAGVPMVEAQLRWVHAQQDMATVQAQSTAIDAKRSQLVAQSQSAQSVMDYLKTLPQPLAILELLSAKIPDTAYLERFDMNAQRVIITGQADNAASLMQVLGATPGIQNVRAPSAITRNPMNNKERFTLEFGVQSEPKS
ncbi:MAG: PilN domain-containing protein [Halothiobacillus sp.]